MARDRAPDQYLLGTMWKILGKPMSSEKVTTVPLGPIFHRTVFDPRLKESEDFSCRINMLEEDN